MNPHFDKVKDYIMVLGYDIGFEDPEDGVIVLNDETAGIHNLVVGCAEPLLIMEQFIVNVTSDNGDVYKKLLQKNRDIIHGAFVLDESGQKVIFRDTLQIENLDINELEGSINSLSLLLTEYSDELLEYSKS